MLALIRVYVYIGQKYRYSSNCSNRLNELKPTNIHDLRHVRSHFRVSLRNRARERLHEIINANPLFGMLNNQQCCLLFTCRKGCKDRALTRILLPVLF